MDINLKDGMIAGVDELKDPSADAQQIAGGSILGTGVSVAGGSIGDEVRFMLEEPSGSLFQEFTISFDQVFRHSYWFWHRTIGVTPGTWTVRIELSGAPAGTRTIEVQ